MTHSNQWLQERADLLATVTEWRERAEAAEAENIEHARLLGMGAERELSLLGRAEAAEAKVAMARSALDYYADRGGEGRKYRIFDEHGDALGTIHDIGHKARTALKAMENTDD